MSKYIKHDGVWKEPADSLKHDGVWKDKETWAKHDGVWKLVAEPFDSGPGPTEKDYDESTGTGYYGEVSHTDLISGDALATEVDLSAGTGQHSAAGWLKFYDQGKVLFVAKKPFRHSLSWNHINYKNLVFGDTEITIDGYTYKVRLLLGGGSSPGTGSEWNRLVYRIHEDVPADQPGDNWAELTNADIVVEFGDGRATWCQESSDTDRVCRGNAGLSDWLPLSPTYVNWPVGWRPVLELVQE